MGRHSTDRVKLTAAELSAAFDGPWAELFPPLLTVSQAADLLQVPKSTIYHKSSEGVLGCVSTKVAGKLRFWRDRLVRLALEKGI